jgi:hypothetical protein
MGDSAVLDLAGRVVVFLSGAAVVVATLFSAIRTFVLPRSARSMLTATVFRTSRRVFELLAWGSYEHRDRVMALYTPVTVFVLAIAWLVLVLVSYAAMFWAIGYGTPADSLWVSGSSLLTLGAAPIELTSHRLLAFTEAALGLGLVAVLIAYLPTLYSAFSRREQMVTMLEVRAGLPPSSVVMLLRLHRIGWRDNLGEEWARWEQWFADLEESHTALPMVIWLRSPRPERSWVTAAGTVLDAAALWLATTPGPPDPNAQLCLRAGYVALRRIADFFLIAYDPDPAPNDPISITRGEFDAVVDQMADAGMEVVADRDAAWRAFAGWRVNYDTVLLRLGKVASAPPATWVSDRAPVA